MLTQFRNQKKMLIFFLWLVIAAFIGTIFLVWGVGNNKNKANYAIKVNEHQISYGEFKNAYDQTSKAIRQVLGGQPIPKSINVEKRVVDELINKYLMLDEAKRLKIPVSNVEVLTEISRIPAFQNNGVFDRERYLQILQANRIRPEAYESDFKQRITLKKVENVIHNSVGVTQLEVENEYKYRNTAANISFVILDPKKYKSQVKFTEKQLEDFYNANKENYRVPEKIKLKYVEFSPDNFKDNSTVSEEEIETYFIQHKKDFTIPETVTAQHIIIKVKDWNDKKEVEEARKKINMILKKAKAGEDFSELAKKYSEGPSKDKGGDLGTFKRGDMIKEFEDVAFSMKDGEISGVVKTSYGFHIIKVNKHVQGKDLKLDEAKDEIIKKIKKEKSKSAYRNYVLQTYKQILKASNISAYAANHKDLKTKETGYFAKGEVVPPFDATFNKMDSLFKLGVSEISSIVDMNGKQYIFEVEDKKDSYIPEFKEVKKKIKDDYIAAEALKIAEKKANDLIKKNDIKEIAKSIKVTYQTTPNFKRIEAIPEIGVDSDLSAKIFEKKDKRILQEPYISDNKVYIIQVNEIIEPDMKGLDNESENLRAYILDLKQKEAFKDYIEKLRANAEIHINPNILPEQ